MKQQMKQWIRTTAAVLSAAVCCTGTAVCAAEETPAQFIGTSLSLTDDLGLNFYVGSADADNKDDFKVVFSGKCEENGSEVRLRKKNGVFCATANVSANNMGAEITAELYRNIEGEWTKTDTAVYSVNAYLADTAPEAGWSADKTAAFGDLVETVKTYGQVAHAYFTTGDMTGIDVPHHTAAELEELGQKPDFDSDDATISLVLDSRMAVRLYIPGLEVGDQAANGKKAIEGRNGSACFAFTGISPTILDMHPAMKFNDVTYQFTPLSWCWRALNVDGGAPKNAAMANILVSYWQDAKAFRSAV